MYVCVFVCVCTCVCYVELGDERGGLAALNALLMTEPYCGEARIARAQISFARKGASAVLCCVCGVTCMPVVFCLL